MFYGKSENAYCEKCEVDLVPVESDDALILKYRCPQCNKKWGFHLNEDSYLCQVIVTDPSESEDT